jgi:hypothetical protein
MHLVVSLDLTFVNDDGQSFFLHFISGSYVFLPLRLCVLFLMQFLEKNKGLQHICNTYLDFASIHSCLFLFEV